MAHDYSKYSDEQLMEMLNSGKYNQKQKQLEQNNNFLNDVGNFGMGFLKGGAQNLADMGASTINAIPQALEAINLKGKKLPQVPHFQIANQNPNSLSESLGQDAGNLAAYLIPGMGQLKAGRALYKGASVALEALTHAGLGAGVGALTNEENRGAGAIGGAAMGALSTLPITKAMAAKNLKEAEKMIAQRNVRGIPVEKEIFKDIRNYLPKSSATKKLINKAESGDYKSLFTLQSDLQKTARELTKSASGAERLEGFEAYQTHRTLLDQIKQHLSKQGHNDIAQKMTRGRAKYRQHMQLRKPLDVLEGVTTAAIGIPKAIKSLLGVH